MKRFWFIALSLVFVLAACAPKSTAVPAPVSSFNYDAAVPFDTKIISQSEQSGVTVTELSYAAHDSSFAINTDGRTMATLVSPKGSGPFAGILYVHTLSDLYGGRHEYLNEAITMAQHGAVSLLPQENFPYGCVPIGTQADRAMYIGQVIELRRAFDFLLTQPGVDPQRLGYVGHGFGGVYGGILAGVDKRAKTYVLIAGVPRFADAANACGNLNIPTPQYQTYVKDIDPINFVPNTAPASIFFQFYKGSAVPPESPANQYSKAASQPKKIEWYEDIHDMHTDPVVAAHQAWLIEQLKLAP